MYEYTTTTTDYKAFAAQLATSIIETDIQSGRPLSIAMTRFNSIATAIHAWLISPPPKDTDE